MFVVFIVFVVLFFCVFVFLRVLKKVNIIKQQFIAFLVNNLIEIGSCELEGVVYISVSIEYSSVTSFFDDYYATNNY